MALNTWRIQMKWIHVSRVTLARGTTTVCSAEPSVASTTSRAGDRHHDAHGEHAANMAQRRAVQLMSPGGGPVRSDKRATQKGVVMGDYDIHISGGTIVDGTGVPRRRGDLWIKDGRIAQIGGRVRGRRRPGDRCDRQDRRPRLRRLPHPLRRPDPLGPVVHDLRLARRHVRRARQLRLRLRAGRARLPRPLDADDDAHRGDPLRGDEGGHALGLGDHPGVPRLASTARPRASTSSSTCRRRR